MNDTAAGKAQIGPQSGGFSPREIVSELDRFIVGQGEAKRAVAIALRNRWRRQQLDEDMREEVLPKNILMIGPTGVGKTEISRRLAKLANAPFLKVEATKFTEVGYVGRDVDQIVRDLVETAISLVRVNKRKEVRAKAHLQAEERVLHALVGANASPATRDSFRKRLRDGELDDKEIEIQISDSGGGSGKTRPSTRLARISSTTLSASARSELSLPGAPMRHTTVLCVTWSATQTSVAARPPARRRSTVANGPGSPGSMTNVMKNRARTARNSGPERARAAY